MLNKLAAYVNTIMFFYADYVNYPLSKANGLPASSSS